MKKRVVSAGLVCLLLLPMRMFGFTQGVEHAGSVVPVGHEWVTRQAAIELLNAETYLDKDANDPRLKWPASALASDTSLAGAEAETNRIKSLSIKDLRFAATYKPIYDAILGERWVDIGGVNFVGARWFDKTDCLDMVTQEHPDVQYDHFMRKPSDAGAAGGVTTARESALRFVQYFVAAAEAADGNMKVWDGGGYSGEYTVDRHYFLFGRALHLFEDSFSPDHTVRSKDDYFRKVRQVKSYLCGEGSEQHAHLNPPSSAFNQTGDVIWVSMALARHANDWSGYKPSNIRDYGLASIEGTKEAWASFIRTMAKPKAERSGYAQAEARKLAAKWLGFDEQEMLGWYRVAEHRGSTYVKSGNGNDDGGQGQTQAQCMTRDWKGATVKAKLEGFEAGRRKCLYNMLPTWGVQTDVDPSLHLAYYWVWRNKVKLIDPPADWKIGSNDTALPVRFINRENGQTMSLAGNDWAYNGPGTVIELMAPWPLTPEFTLPVVGRSNQYLNRYGDKWGMVGIYSSTHKGWWSFERRPDGYYNIKNFSDSMYMYMHTDQKDYINGDGRPENKNAQWRIEGLPEPSPPDGTYSYSSSGGSEPIIMASNGQVSFGPAGGAVAYAELQRQTDGRYKIKIEGVLGGRGGYVALDSGGNRLWFNGDPTYASTFALQQQQEKGHFKIVSQDGTYWSRKAKAGGLILSSAPADCEDAAQGCQEPLVLQLTWVRDLQGR